MSCDYPMRAQRALNGTITLGKPRPDTAPVALRCGGCLGCRTDKAKEWALRCHLELNDHEATCFTTLTYDDEHLPPTLEPRATQLWLKRLRKRLDANRRIRYFLSGEYGEQNGRPHYHAILFGASTDDAEQIHDAWLNGRTETTVITPQRISYCAGYTAKKVGWRKQPPQEMVDPSSGEVYTYQQPFIRMSRRPYGIGGGAKKHSDSWRAYAINNGHRMPVPRFLHDAWLNTATQEQTEQLEYERYQQNKNKTPVTEKILAARAQIRATQHAISAAKRTL